MKRAELIFPRPIELQATSPPEHRLPSRDAVRLMVSTPDGHQHTQFNEIHRFLQAGDLLVVNDSATLPASLPAEGALGQFIFNCSTDYGHGLWLGEPRWSSSKPGPLPLKSGEQARIGGLQATFIAQYPDLPELWFVQIAEDIQTAMRDSGKPITYGYIQNPYPIDDYQTIFSKVPGSAEMPSAGRPFTQRVLNSLKAKGVQIASLTLHTGVSSLEVEVEDVEEHPLYPEPYHIPAAAAQTVNAALADKRRIVAVGTTVVRALESAWDGKGIQPKKGFTRLYIHPERGVNVVDGLITGLHDPVTSHLAMLYTIAGQSMIRSAYEEAVREGYLWHEFGDSHLILTREPSQNSKYFSVEYPQAVSSDAVHSTLRRN